MNRRRSGVIKGLSWLVIDLCLLASVASVWLAWGVLYPRVDEFDANETFDAIVVLSGEDRRIERGLELVEEGRAPELVVSFGERWSAVTDRCGTTTTYRIVCPVPPEDSTRGEARMIRDLAQRSAWSSVLVITGDYHAARARLVVDWCLQTSTRISFEIVEWDNLPSSVIRQEVFKTLGSYLSIRSC